MFFYTLLPCAFVATLLHNKIAPTYAQVQDNRGDGDLLLNVNGLQPTGKYKIWILRANFDAYWEVGDNLTASKAMKDIHERYFAKNGPSLHSTYQGCSANKVEFVAADGDCPNIVTMPKLEVSNPRNIAASSFGLYLSKKVDKDHKNCKHDIKVFILPKGIRNAALGLTSFDKATGTFQYVFIRDDFWDDVSTIAHEVAHVFEKPDAFSLKPMLRYKDFTDLLGNYIDKDGKMCFNAGRYASLDWFNNNNIEVDLVISSYIGFMVSANTMSKSVVEGSAVADDFILKMKVGGTYLYAMFSRAEGVTENQPVHDNTITIVEMTAVHRNTFFVGVATIDEPFNEVTNGETVIVEICRIESGPPEAALVIAYIEGKTDTECPEHPSALPTGSIQPTPSPTANEPTKSPSPTFVPSDAPSLLPSSSEIEDYEVEVYYYPQICEDSASVMYFPYKNKKRGCVWVRNNPERIIDKCLKPGVKSHCPYSCDVCHEDYRCKDSSKKFLVNGIKRSCNWVKSDESKITKRCNKPNVASTCRETCKFCSNDCSDNDSFKFTIFNGKKKGCAWLTRDPERAEKRKNNWCPKIFDQCEASCGACSPDVV